MRRYSVFVLLISISILVVVSACQPQPSATPTPTRTPGVVINQPTPVPATEVPAATQPASAGRVGPDSYPANVNPLTGLVSADPTVLQHSTLAIKVSNNVAARPQSGLSFADLVFEHYAEGGETRYTGIFYSQSPERVGSVRSGRLIDLEIIPMFDAILTGSGFSDGTLKRLADKPWSARNLSGPAVGAPSLIRLQLENVAVEHTEFAVPSALWDLATQRGLNTPPNLVPGLAFDPAVPAGGTSASHVTIDFGLSWTKVDWQYDPVTGLYVRTLGGKPHTDALNDQQLTAANVLVVGAIHTRADYIEDGFSGELSTEIQVWGEGPASLFRDGQRIEGHWTRLDPQQMLQFTDLSGAVLLLKPGQTWFEMVPIGFDKLIVTP
jgi:hypothetical protein